MREIKFRAWNKDYGMCYNCEPFYAKREFFLFGISVGFSHYPENIDEWKIMQYTGFKDKNGKEIYEGDIVRFTYWWFHGNECESAFTGQIIYSNENMSFQLKGIKNEEWEKYTGYENDIEYLTPFSELNFDEADFEIVGNIYETEINNEEK